MENHDMSFKNSNKNRMHTFLQFDVKDFYPSLKDTHREKAPSNKTPAKTMNLYI